MNCKCNTKKAWYQELGETDFEAGKSQSLEAVKDFIESHIKTGVSVEDVLSEVKSLMKRNNKARLNRTYTLLFNKETNE